jgi:outer membrane protein TolC
MKSYKSLLAAFPVIFSGFVFTQEPTSFSVTEAEEYAVTHSIKVMNTALDMEIAQKKIWETTAIGLPQVRAEGTFQNLLYIPTTVVDASLFNPSAPPGEVMAFQMGQKYNVSAALNVSQLLFDGSYIIGLQFAKFYKKMSETQVELTKQEVKQLTREAYYQVLVAKKNLELMDSLVPITEEMMRQMKVIKETGMSGSDPVDQMELAYNRLLAARTSAERQVEIATSLLKMQMGYAADQPLEVTVTFDELLREVRAAAASSETPSIQDNSAYVMLEQQQIANTYALKNQKAGYLPSLGAFFTHSQNAYRNQFNFFADEEWYPTTIWGISLKVPVTSSGMKIAQVKQAEIKVEQGANSLEHLETNLEFAALRIQLSMQDALETLRLEEANIELSQKLYQNSLRKESIGTEGAMMATQLQAQALNAQGGYIGAALKLFQLKVELDKLYNQ